MPLRCNLARGVFFWVTSVGGKQTSFSFPVEGGECSERRDEDAKVGEGDEERKPIHFEIDCTKLGMEASPRCTQGAL